MTESIPELAPKKPLSYLRPISFVSSADLRTVPATEPQSKTTDPQDIVDFYSSVLSSKSTAPRNGKSTTKAANGSVRKRIATRPRKALHKGLLRECSSTTRQMASTSGDLILKHYTTDSPSIAAHIAGSTIHMSSSSPIDTKYKELPTKSESSTYTVWCSDCSLSIPMSAYAHHIRGTAHLVSSNSSTAPPDILTLNENNKGFQMLKAQGWKYEEGLGTRGQGRRHPIATALKNDRFGLGHEDKAKKRVTHFREELEERKGRKQERILTRRDIVKMDRKDREQRLAMIAYMNR
jgi:hypothetical protein